MKPMRVVAWAGVALALVFLQDGIGLARHGFRNMPAMVMELPGGESGYGAGLDAAVKQRFPVGSEEEGLVAYLKAEGFAPEWRSGQGPNAAAFVQAGLVCRKRARVTWRADERGLLSEVGGSYESRCIVSGLYT